MTDIPVPTRLNKHDYQQLRSAASADSYAPRAAPPPDEIRRRLPTDAVMAQNFIRLELFRSENRVLVDRLLTAERGFAARMGLPSVPPIFVVNESEGVTTPHALVGQTREGFSHILLLRSALNSLQPRELESLLALETARIAGGDVEPANVAAQMGDLSIAHMRTLAADSRSAGPQGTCDPAGLQQALSTIIGTYNQSSIAAGQLPRDDTAHSPINQRLDLLEEQKQRQLARGTCPAFPPRMKF